MNFVNLEIHLENSSYLGYCLNNQEMFIKKFIAKIRYKNFKTNKEYTSFNILGSYFWYKKKLQYFGGI